MVLHHPNDCDRKTRVLAMIVLITASWLACPLATQSCSAEKQFPSKKPVEGSSTTANLVWRSGRVCGANCLYLVLRSRDIKVDYCELQGRLLKEQFASLYDLRDVARQYGIELMLSKLTPNDLRKVPVPAILHLESVTPTGELRRHFITVLALVGKAEESVVYLDGTTAEIVKRSTQSVLKDWTGFVAYVNEATLFNWKSAWGLMGGALAGAGIAVLLPKAWSLRRLPPPESIHSRGL
jgi:hypothetical protein